MKVRFNEKAQKDLRQHQKAGRKAVLKKIVDLIESILELGRFRQTRGIET